MVGFIVEELQQVYHVWVGPFASNMAFGFSSGLLSHVRCTYLLQHAFRRLKKKPTSLQKAIGKSFFGRWTFRIPQALDTQFGGTRQKCLGHCTWSFGVLLVTGTHQTKGAYVSSIEVG